MREKSQRLKISLRLDNGKQIYLRIERRGEELEAGDTEHLSLRSGTNPVGSRSGFKYRTTSILLDAQVAFDASVRRSIIEDHLVRVVIGLARFIIDLYRSIRLVFVEGGWWLV